MPLYLFMLVGVYSHKTKKMKKKFKAGDTITWTWEVKEIISITTKATKEKEIDFKGAEEWSALHKQNQKDGKNSKNSSGQG
jgi:plastocyanin